MWTIQIFRASFFGALVLTGCAPTTPPSISARAERIVSLDFCADQYVLQLVEHDRILALSPDATSPFSYLRKEAEGFVQVRPLAEDALVLKPDLIVRSYGGGVGAAEMFERAGVPVAQVGWAGDLEGVRRVVGEIGEALDATEAANDLIAEIDRRLDALSDSGNRARALYVTPSGTTTGPGSLIHELIVKAGLNNYQTEPGWRSLPLEKLIRDSPDLVATAFFDDPRRGLDRWSAMRHPIARAQLDDRPVIDLPGAWVSCGAWFVLDAMEAMDKAADSLFIESEGYQ